MRLSPDRKPVQRGLLRLLASMATIAVLMAPASAMAAEIRSGEGTVTVRANEVIEDDLYVYGQTINIEGTVRGDVIAAAAADLNVTGSIGGDLNVVGSTVNVGGAVGGSVRALAGTLTMTSQIGADVVAGAQVASLATGARVGRDVLAAAPTVDLLGAVGRNVTTAGTTLTVGAPVGGSVNADTSTLRLTSGAVVQGDVSYASSREAERDGSAVVNGSVTRREPVSAAAAQPSLQEQLVGYMRNLVGLMVFGTLTMLLFAGFTERAANTLGESAPLSTVVGLGLLLGVPLVSALVFIIGVVVGGWWISLVLLPVYVVLLLAGYLLGATFVGRWLLRRLSQPSPTPWSLILGLLVLGLVALLPFFGEVTVATVTLLGTGALVRTAIAVYRESRAGSVELEEAGA